NDSEDTSSAANSGRPSPSDSAMMSNSFNVALALSTDPLTFVAVDGLLILVGLAASAIPAVRAARLDPIVTLKDESPGPVLQHEADVAGSARPAAPCRPSLQS